MGRNRQRTIRLSRTRRGEILLVALGGVLVLVLGGSGLAFSLVLVPCLTILAARGRGDNTNGGVRGSGDRLILLARLFVNRWHTAGGQVLGGSAENGLLAVGTVHLDCSTKDAGVFEGEGVIKRDIQRCRREQRSNGQQATTEQSRSKVKEAAIDLILEKRC